MINWVQVQIFGVLGLVFTKAYSLAQFKENSWVAKTKVVSSEALRQYAWFSLLKVLKLHWLVCEPIMYKFFLFHSINLLVPGMHPLENLMEDWGF